MAAPAAITGNYFVSVGFTTTLSDETAGGSWSSSDESIATVSSMGVVTGIAAGDVVISYTNNDGAATFDIEVVEATVTNGFNVDRIVPAMAERIGWEQTYTSGLPTLSTLNKKAKSARYYNDFHEACTIKNIYDIQEAGPDISDDDFNALLLSYDRKCTMRSLNAVFNQPCLIEHMLGYYRTWNRLNIQIPNTGNFVGYRVNVANGDYAVVFDAISLLFNGVATFNLYLFNDLVLEPIRTKQVTTVANSQTKVQLNWTVNYNEQYNGGIYYLGYFQNDLGSVKAIDEQLNLWADSKVFGGLPFQAAQVGELDFYRQNPAANYRSYGLNIEMSAYHDYTRVITQNAHVFDECRGLLMAITIIESIKNSTRTNDTQRQIAQNLEKWDYDMNGMLPMDGQPYVAGLKDQLKRAYKTAAETFNKKVQAMSMPIGGGQSNMEYLGFNVNTLPNRQTLS